MKEHETDEYIKDYEKKLSEIEKYKFYFNENLHKIDQLLNAYEYSLQANDEQTNQKYRGDLMGKYIIKLRTIYNKMKRANENNNLDEEEKHLMHFYEIVREMRELGL